MSSIVAVSFEDLGKAVLRPDVAINRLDDQRRGRTQTSLTIHEFGLLSVAASDVQIGRGPDFVVDISGEDDLEVVSGPTALRFSERLIELFHSETGGILEHGQGAVPGHLKELYKDCHYVGLLKILRGEALAYELSSRDDHKLVVPGALEPTRQAFKNAIKTGEAYLSGIAGDYDTTFTNVLFRKDPDVNHEIAVNSLVQSYPENFLNFQLPFPNLSE
jgi:hypothetical protein